MAIDSREKRAAVLGVGRPWMRDKLPGTNDKAWRVASGNAYPGSFISVIVTAIIETIGIAVINMTDSSDADIHRPNA